MSVKEEAKRNLELAGLFDKDSDYGGMLGHAVMKLVEAHCSEGHSGFSHELTLQIFNKVIKGHALTAKYWDERKEFMEKFAEENMGEPWKPELMEEMIGPRP
jgi:hypothetical protein